MSGPRLTTVAAAAVLLIALSACASPTTEPTSAAPEPTPTVTTPAPQGDPAPRTPVDCAGAVDSSAVGALLGGEATLSPSDALRFPSNAARIQQGVLVCYWNAGSAYLSLAISPLDIWESTPTGLDRVCSVEFATGHCGAWEQAGEFYAEAQAVVFDDPQSQSAMTSAFTTVMDGLTQALSAGPLPAWVSPEHGVDRYPSCDGFDVPELYAALGATSGPNNYDSGDGFSGVYQALSAAGYGSCSWDLGVGSFEVAYAAGGAWALPTSGGEPIAVPGAADATTTCDEFGCRIDARVGETWVAGYFNSDESPEPAAERLATVIPYLPIEPAPAA
jgi:hypothetical protein